MSEPVEEVSTLWVPLSHARVCTYPEKGKAGAGNPRRECPYRSNLTVGHPPRCRYTRSEGRLPQGHGHPFAAGARAAEVGARAAQRRESVVPRPLTRGSGGRERKEKRLEEPRRSSRSSARTRGARREEARGAGPRRPHGARRRRRRGARGEPRRQRCSASVRGAEEIIIVSQSGRGGARQHKHHTALRRTREETTRGTAGGPFISPNARSDERMEREEKLAELGASNGNPKDSERDRP